MIGSSSLYPIVLYSALTLLLWMYLGVRKASPRVAAVLYLVLGVVLTYNSFLVHEAWVQSLKTITIRFEYKTNVPLAPPIISIKNGVSGTQRAVRLTHL
jgi:hypothetical protein